MSSQADATGTGEQKGGPLVFISYSHKDEVWKDRLRPHLGLLERDDLIVIWDDRQIEPTAEWYDEIMAVIARASIAVCLISADYLNSEFCTKEEIPYLLRRRKEEGMHLFLVLLRPCAWQAISWLKALQMLPRDGKAVASDFKDDWDTPFAELTSYVFGKLKEVSRGPISVQKVLKRVRPPRVIIDYEAQPPAWPAISDDRVAIDRLPITGAELFGRQAELTMLDDAWAHGKTHVVSLVAWGGVGKSTLVNKWLEGLKTDNWRGACQVYAWSFYSQGTGERVTSADDFIADALRFFGDPDPTQGSPWSKGERLADLVRTNRTLLILDGLEPLQSGHEFDRGRIQDPGLARLIEELSRENHGLCVITTRERVPELDEEDWCAFTQQVDLEQISPDAGRALLRVKGVRGTDTELEQASREFGNHALAINLLANFLRAIPGRPIAMARSIPDLNVRPEMGRHARRILAAFAKRFENQPEIDVLRMLGLFDRPAGINAIMALLAPPAIPGLTEHLSGIHESVLMVLARKLGDLGLLALRDHHSLSELDSHPIVREYFSCELQSEQNAASWKGGHCRLFEYFVAEAAEDPKTIKDMAPLTKLSDMDVRQIAAWIVFKYT